jgi:hypothetical protein
MSSELLDLKEEISQFVKGVRNEMQNVNNKLDEITEDSLPFET